MEGLQSLLEMLRNIHREDMDARERWHREEMAAQKEVHTKLMEVQKAELIALKEAHADQLGALVARLPKRSESAMSIPSFASFDPTLEGWKDYIARFETFVGANSILEAKNAQVS